MTSIHETSTTSSLTLTRNLIGRLGASCMVAALLSGVLKGVWELVQPILNDPHALASAPRAQLWAHALLEVIKPAGFLAGLFGFYFCATKRGLATKLFMALAVLGGVFYASVWLWIAATTHFTIIYVLGGMWYQMIAPVALGVAALFARRVPWWNGVWAIIVGVLNAQIFALLGPAKALFVQGIIWLVFGYLVYNLRRRCGAHKPGETQ